MKVNSAVEDRGRVSVVSFRKQKRCLLHLSGCPRQEDVVLTMCLTQDRKTYGVLSQVALPCCYIHTQAFSVGT